MNKILVGSKALIGKLKNFNRIPFDTDYLIDVDVEIKEKNTTNTEYIYCPLFFTREDFFKDGVATLKGMLNLKYSHLRRDLSWDKHLFDFLTLLNELGEENLDYEFCLELSKFWDEKYPLKYKRSDLTLNKTDFFTNKVNSSIDEHDFLHTLINPTPAYTLLLKDNCDVELDENKWNNSSDEFKKSVVLEETIVMASERNYKHNTHFRKALTRQLKDNIKKHFPEYIAHYAIINYIDIINFDNDTINKYNTLIQYINDGSKKNK